MADKKELNVTDALHYLHKSLKSKIDDFAEVALELRKKETAALAKDEMGSADSPMDGGDSMAMAEAKTACTGTALCKCAKCEGLEKYAKGELNANKAGAPKVSEPKISVPKSDAKKDPKFAAKTVKAEEKPHEKFNREHPFPKGIPVDKSPKGDTRGIGEWQEDERKKKASTFKAESDASAREKAEDGSDIKVNPKAKLPGLPKEVDSKLDEGSGGQIEKGPSIKKAALGMAKPALPKIAAPKVAPPALPKAPVTAMPKASAGAKPAAPKAPGMAAPAMKAEKKPSHLFVNGDKAKAMLAAAKKGAEGEGKAPKMEKADLAPGTVLHGQGTKVPGVGHKAPATSAPVKTMVERVAAKMPTAPKPVSLPGAHLFGGGSAAKAQAHIAQLPSTKKDELQPGIVAPLKPGTNI